MVDYAVDYISPEMEAKIFTSFNGSKAGVVSAKDPKQAELQRMVDQLRECVHLAYPLTVHLIDTEDANAMAFPGGRIIVFKAMTPDKGGKNLLGHYFNSHPQALERINNLNRLGKEMNFDVKIVKPLNNVFN